MKTNFKSILQFAQASSVFLRETPEETKLKYAVKKVLDRVQSIQAEHDEAKEDICLEFANVDKNGSVLYRIDEAGRKLYDFTAEGTKKVRQAHKDLHAENRYEVKPHFTSEIPEDLPEDLRKPFTGFVIQAGQPEAEKLTETIND